MRWFKRLAIAIVIGLLALEVLLQIGFFAVYSFASPPDQSGPADVLCIGDSYTFGLGASSAERSYPRVLEALLRERRPRTTVANTGWHESMRALLAAGADVNARADDGLSALLVASSQDGSGGVAALVKAGAEVNVRTTRERPILFDVSLWAPLGATPLMLAVCCNVRLA